MTKAETIIRFTNVLLGVGIIVISVFVGLFRLSGMPLRQAFTIAATAFGLAALVVFIGMQYILR